MMTKFYEVVYVNKIIVCTQAHSPPFPQRRDSANHVCCTVKRIVC